MPSPARGLDTTPGTTVVVPNTGEPEFASTSRPAAMAPVIFPVLGIIGPNGRFPASSGKSISWNVTMASPTSIPPQACTTRAIANSGWAMTTSSCPTSR